MALLVTTCALIAALVAAELLIIPRMFGLPRDLALLGLVASGPRVDDTAINSIGFTGDVPVQPKPPSTRRIVTLGGSAIFNRRMTERLKTAITARSNRPVEVIGAALRTHTSRASVLKYRYLSQYQPDTVIVYEGINDLWANHVPAERFRADYAHLNPWYNRTFPLDVSLTARVVYNRLAAGSTHALEDFLSGSPKAVVNGADFRSAAVLEGNLRELVTMIRHDGGVPILLTFAWTIPANYSRTAFEAGELGYVNPDHYEAFPIELWGPVAFVREGLARHEDVVRRVAHEMDVLLLDARTMIGDRIELFGDVCHFNDRGTDEFIRGVVDFLVQHDRI